MPHKKTPLLAVAALGLVLAVACSSPSSQPSSEQALCDSLSAFNDSVQAIADTDPATDSVEDVQAKADDAQTAWEQVQADAANVAEADDAALDAAWSSLSQTINNLPTDVPMSQAWDEVQSGVDDVQSVYGEMRDGLGCAA